MAKVIVTLNGVVQQEISLLKPRLTIGRRPNNDLVLDQLTVSGQHAAIDTSSIGVFVLDLGSTNGTLVNGQPITKHLLQHGDVFEIGKYRLRYQATDDARVAELPASSASPELVDGKSIASELPARVKILNGSNANKELVLSKPVTTLGSPGKLVVSIVREQQIYLLKHIEGNFFARVNDQSMNGKVQRLCDKDVIDLSGTKMQFLLSK
jgi:hypothetical protein